ncbi:MAG: hypothetical protein C4519_05900 [Desulfobacteraceae bacterium]|nr:MAG: hypothetical protein C4519_05900 [Desulfobacteraceae bacterium]
MADCTRLALKEIAPDADWVLAGINQGANLGSDVYQSGTVAAAREAAILGKKSIAVSQYIAPDWLVDWDAAIRYLARVLQYKPTNNNLSGALMQESHEDLMDPIVQRAAGGGTATER